MKVSSGQLAFDDFQESCAMMWQKYAGSRRSMPLGARILFHSVLYAGGFAIVYYLIQKFHSRALYYKLAVEQLQSHPEAQEALGTPLNIHYLKLIDRENFVDIADAQLKIPVSGSKSEGLLYVHSSRSGPFQRYPGKVTAEGEREEDLLMKATPIQFSFVVKLLWA
ncbi:cytochrome c oxidase assembly factor 1 homolog isoform X3 [Hylobates moloch]|uniref:cytochrome c oxidase assembly factor 1 homolog isoform X3 n=1 Tax=Hylobates moloch TaxID=81572 RepID=UPI00267749FD|nr:cytochrome c oxidase assembly factor 1 homolog isoform X3 [Hylobates moloch]